MKILTQLFYYKINELIRNTLQGNLEYPTSENSITCHSFEAYMYKNTTEL